MSPVYLYRYVYIHSRMDRPTAPIKAHTLTTEVGGEKGRATRQREISLINREGRAREIYAG